MADLSSLVSEVEKLNDDEQVKFLVEYVSRRNALWLSNATKALEDKFGVSAAVAVAAAPAAGAAQAGQQQQAQAEQKSSFNVVLKAAGANRLNVIKIVKAHNPNLGLKEAKELVDTAPKPVKENVAKEEAEKILKELKDAGADVELK